MNTLKFISIGGIGSVTKNMYVYETDSEMLLVDCGLGFADETMLGVELMIPDISYILQTKKKIVGMVLSHGHEDHIGGLPFVIPQLPSFPIYGTPLTAAFANAKFQEFRIPARVTTVNFDGGDIALGQFKISFIRVTHSIPDASNLFIRTPAGNFYHGSDFKFDMTPFDKKPTDFQKIVKCSSEGVMCLMSDALGSEKRGHTASEMALEESIEREMRNTEGKFLLTTYSSNISRINQALIAAQRLGRKVCFMGRSLLNATEIAERLGYMKFPKNFVINMDQLKSYRDKDLCLIVAGSQGQENSAMTRIANGEHTKVKLNPKDVVVFSADPIPGNELSINAVIDEIARVGAKVIYSGISDQVHVSGHAASQDLLLMMSLVKPQNVVPIGATFKQMVAYRNLAKIYGLSAENIFLPDDGQEVTFGQGIPRLGQKLPLRNVFVDEVSGAEVEQYVLRDRQKIAQEGVVIVMLEVDSANGNLLDQTIIARGMTAQETQFLQKNLQRELKKSFSGRNEPLKDLLRFRKSVSRLCEGFISRELRKNPLVLPVIVEV